MRALSNRFEAGWVRSISAYVRKKAERRKAVAYLAQPRHPPAPQPCGAHLVVLSESSLAAWLRSGDARCWRT